MTDETRNEGMVEESKTKAKKAAAQIAEVKQHAEDPVGGNGGAASAVPAEPDAPQPVGLNAEDTKMVNKTVDKIRDVQSRHSNAREAFVQTEKNILSELDKAREHMTSVIKALQEKHEVPENWIFNLSEMAFVPPKPPSAEQIAKMLGGAPPGPARGR